MVGKKECVIATGAAAGSTAWLLIAQVVLLVLYYGFHVILPWWVLFLPLLYFVWGAVTGFLSHVV